MSERLFLGLVLLGFVVSLFGLRGRGAAEKQNQATEIVLDAKSLLEWEAILEGEQKSSLRQRLLKARVTSLAVNELVLDDLIETGKATPFSEQEFGFALAGGSFAEEAATLQAALLSFHKTSKPKVVGCYLVFTDAALAESVKSHLDVTIPGEVDCVQPNEGRFLWVPLSARAMKTRGLGFDKADLRKLAADGFAIWLRPQNVPGVTRPQLEGLFQGWDKLLEPGQIHGVVFGGGANEALGYPDPERLKGAAELLAEREWRVGYVELAPKAQQDGIESVVRAKPTNVTRVLAVSAPHQAKLTPSRVLGMYSLGARERNIRVLYVRPFAVPGKHDLDEQFLFQLADEVRSQNQLASTFSTPSPAPSLALTAVLAVAAGALAVLLLRAIGLSVPMPLSLAILALPVIGTFAAVAVGKYSLFRCLLALAVGMAAPCLAFLKILYPSLAEPKPGNSLLEGLRLLVLLSLVSLAAGLCAAALLPDTTFLLGLDRFRGVKLLTLGTPVLIVALCVIKHYPINSLVKGMTTSIQVYQAALVGGLGLVFGFLYLRTGNDAGGAASEWERNLRVVLDRFLGVRPRFKEFLIAHPAMVCAPFLGRKTGFLPSLVLILLAAVGQAGIVDTFAHIHTPLGVTLTRVILGVLFGLLCGALAWCVLHLLWGAVSKQMARYNIDATV